MFQSTLINAITSSFDFLLLQVALSDLRSNSKIGPLVPYFLNLVALSVNKLKRNGRLTDALLRTSESLVDSPYIDPSSQLAVTTLFIYIIFKVHYLTSIVMCAKLSYNYNTFFLQQLTIYITNFQNILNYTNISWLKCCEHSLEYSNVFNFFNSFRKSVVKINIFIVWLFRMTVVLIQYILIYLLQNTKKNIN